MKGDADGAEDSHGEADFAGLEAEAAGEEKGEATREGGRGRWLGGVPDGGGEEDEPEGVEGADVEGEEEARS